MDINILIIEDQPEAAKLLENTLKGVGYKVWVTEDPRQGIRLLRSTLFAVVITELRSGIMNGVEVTRAVHKITPFTNVIVITAYSFINSAVEAMEAGAYGYITKPFNTSEIRIVVSRAVERFYLLSTDAERDYYQELSAVDGLTGVYNHRYFSALLSNELQTLRRYPGKLSLVMIDLDNFKSYNDTYGHPAGDELLRKAAEVFKKSVREGDVVCRYGGEEFVIVLFRTPKKGAEFVAERILSQVRLYLPVTVSMGIATYPEDAEDAQTLVEKADAALYQAKHSGKNRYCLVEFKSGNDS